MQEGIKRDPTLVIKLRATFLKVNEILQNENPSYIEDIQMFGVNMTFISSSEVKKCIFHECLRHE